jgi:hypothetical protein
MALDDLKQINRWHILFDELCVRAGFHDVASLAARYCEVAGNGAQKEHDTTLRNLNNWRSGRHIPRLRSLRILEQVLGIREDPALLEQWTALYRQANETGEDSPSDIPRVAVSQDGAPARNARWVPALPGLTTIAGAVVVFCLGIAVGNIWASGWRLWGGPADDAPLVRYNPEVFMTVGQSKVIHAERGDCGKLPRDWQDVAGSLPGSALGTFSDGGLAQRNSMFCKGRTPARAIVFNAERVGVEELRIEGDHLKITVSPANQ